MRKIVYFLSVLLIFSYCSLPDIPDDPKAPKWDVAIERIPLLKADTLRIGDELSTEDFERVGADSILSISITDTTTFDIADQLKLESQTESFSEPVGNIEMSSQTESFSESIGNFEISASESVQADIVFAELYPLLTYIEGTNSIVPSTNIAPAIENDIDFNDFNSVTVISGGLNIDIGNYTGFYIGDNVTLDLIDVDNSTTIGSVNIDGSNRLSNGQTGSFFIDLSGQTISGNLKTSLYGFLIGSDGEIVYIPVGSNITITVTPYNIVASSATAKISSQDFDVSGSVDFSTSDETIQSAKIESGTMNLSVTNPFEYPITVTVVIPDIKDGSQQAVNASLPIGAQTSAQTAVDLSNTDMNLADQNLDIQTTLSITPDPNTLYTLTNTDQLTVNAEFAGISLSETTAKISSRSFDVSGTVEIDSDSLDVKNAKIKQGSMDISITNPFSYPIEVSIAIPNLMNASGQGTNIYFYINSNSSSQTEINMSNYELDLDNKDLNFNTSMQIHPDPNIYYTFNSTNELTVTANFSNIMLSEVTGDFNLNTEFPEINESIFDDPPDELENIEFSNATMTLRFPNSPFDMNVDIDIVATKGSEVRRIEINEFVQTGGSIVLGSEIVQLLNLVPEDLVISGNVHVAGQDITFTDDDVIDVEYEVQLPLEFTLTNSSFTDSDSLGIDDDIRDQMRDNMVSASLEITIENSIPIGGTLSLYVGPDSLHINTQILTVTLPQPTVSTTTGFVTQPGVQNVSVSLIKEKFESLADAMFMKFQIDLTDITSPVKLTANDYVIIKEIYISGSMTVDPESFENEDEE